MSRMPSSEYVSDVRYISRICRSSPPDASTVSAAPPLRPRPPRLEERLHAAATEFARSQGRAHGAATTMSLPPLPPSLKLIKPYLDRASELRDKDLMVSYHCGLFALQEAMKMRASLPKEDMGFIMALMDSLEKEKEGLADLEDAAIKVENFGQELFMRADDRDRSGSSDL
eukprot:6188795-Pleurochrysis_carterae.AAC.1